MRNDQLEITADPISEARRYVENAREILKDRGKLNVEENRYEDAKCVKAAGHYLWHAVLLSLEAVFHLKKNNRSRVHVERYRELLAVRDRKLLNWVNDAYETMHLVMGYDGTSRKATCDDGLHLANEIIDRCAKITENGKRRTENYE